MDRDHSPPIAERLAARFDRADGRWTLSNPTFDVLTGVVRALEAAADPPTIDVLGRNEALREFRDDFEVGCRASALIRDDLLRLRVAECDTLSMLLLTPTEAQVVISLDDYVDLFTITDDDWVGDVSDEITAEFEAAEAYSVREPPLDEVFRTASEELGEAFAVDFGAVLEHAAEEGERERFHAVTAALLVGASHGLQNYAVGRWLEGADVASTASASRYKTALEERGVITTEKVEVGLGRPRQRLLLTETAEQSVADTSLERFVFEAFDD
ncbi:DUF5821 family protein [Halobaculum sp. MBLA0143]|uniref:transcriptional regulator TbsP domain-containing protein n=1 Tax=Halobaculum sp. MBLA0143 TaxID=3079933 RepID=UPI0035258314